MRVSVGDFVVINNCDDPENTDKAYVAEIVSLYDTGADVENRFCGTVDWFTRVAELSAHLRPLAVSERELFPNAMSYDRDIELETILDVIQVSKEEGNEENSENKSSVDRDRYFVHRSFDGRKIVAPAQSRESESSKQDVRPPMISLENTKLQKVKPKKKLVTSVLQTVKGKGPFSPSANQKQGSQDENCYQFEHADGPDATVEPDVGEQRVSWAVDKNRSRRNSLVLKKWQRKLPIYTPEYVTLPAVPPVVALAFGFNTKVIRKTPWI